MEIPFYVVDAFTSRVFSGNPAAVCILDSWLEDELMQSIAAENNLSETAFLVPENTAWGLRWFTPDVEVDLCGHATLASAFILSQGMAQDMESSTAEFRFNTKSGELGVSQKDDWYTLDFPSRELTEINISDPTYDLVQNALGRRPVKLVQAASTLIAEIDSESSVRAISPDSHIVGALEYHALIVTARGEHCDFVSRFFAPRVGIDEDPVTGSAHCGLIPYWSGITGKTELLANQVSARGGELRCKNRGERVDISGQAILFSQGMITI